MKRLLIAVLALALAACTGGNLASTGPAAIAGAADGAGLPAPATIADQTTLDEESLLRVERLYKALRTALEMGVDTGLIRGAFAAQIGEGDRKAFALLGAARTAYDTGNAATYRDAVAKAEAAILNLLGDR